MTGSEPPRPRRSRGPRVPRPVRGVRGALAAAALALAATSCAAPALTTDAYRHDALLTTGDLLSAVRTGTLVAELAEDGRAFQPYLQVSAQDVEESARSLTDTFGALQPPAPACDPLRDELTDLANASVHDLSALRIALKREDAAGVAAAAEGLHATASELAELQEELR